MIHPTFFSGSLRDVAIVTDLLRKSAKIGNYTLPSFCGLALYNGREDRNMDAHVNTADDPRHLIKIW